jgi:hypothetical protein
MKRCKHCGVPIPAGIDACPVKTDVVRMLPYIWVMDVPCHIRERYRVLTEHLEYPRKHKHLYSMKEVERARQEEAEMEEKAPDLSYVPFHEWLRSVGVEDLVIIGRL